MSVFFMEMERRKSWLISIIKNSFILPTKHTLATAASHLRHRARAKLDKSEGLVTLYKDMEACGGYGDIKVMWEMIHSSNPPNVQKIQEAAKGSNLGNSIFRQI